jgi:DNA-binding NarL/FixJ family response regulator
MSITVLPDRFSRDPAAPGAAERSLEPLLAQCLESLADVAAARGRRAQAARLREAAALLVRGDDSSGIACVLTGRELEVARLVALGHSNRSIAHTLVISERTVDTHVSHILRKLGIASRVQIAAWMFDRGRRLTLLG